MSITSQNMFYIISSLFIYVNHACNFFFYVLLNKPFRLLLWRKVRQRSTSEAHGTRLSSLRTDNYTLRKLATDTHAIISLLQNRVQQLPVDPVTEYDDDDNNIKTESQFWCSPDVGSSAGNDWIITSKIKMLDDLAAVLGLVSLTYAVGLFLLWKLVSTLLYVYRANSV